LEEQAIALERAGTQLTCITSTKVEILTPEECAACEIDDALLLPPPRSSRNSFTPRATAASAGTFVLVKQVK
jgi:hypothetical protein